MRIRIGRRTKSIVAAVAGLVLSGAACNQDEPDPPDRDQLPAELRDPATPPAQAVFLAPLEGYRTDDDVDVGEIRASLDHGAVPYVAIRRRLILDEQGFTLGDVMVVTLQPDTDGVEQFLQHWFGDAPRDPVEIGGIEMLRIPTQAHDVLAWVGPHFVVTFGRGQEVAHEWLEEVARATVRAIVDGQDSH